MKQLMIPMSLNVMLGLSTSGWKIERVFNVCIEKITDIENAVSESGLTNGINQVIGSFIKQHRYLRFSKKRAELDLIPDYLNNYE